MATPLTLKIVAQVEDAALDATNQKLNQFNANVQKATVTATGSKEEVKKFIEGIKQIGQESKKSGASGVNSFGSLLQQVRHLHSEFLVFRHIFVIGGLIAAPLIIAAKSAIDLNNSLKPVTASLTQLGNAGKTEANNFAEFIKNITAGTSTTLKEGIDALNTFITKTKGTIGAEEALIAAHTLATARGIKFADSITAIADALNGDAAALSNLTLKTKEEINELVRSGQLTKTIQENFKESAESAQSGTFEFWKRVGVSAVKGLTAGFNLISGATALKEQQEKVEQQLAPTRFKKTLEDLAKTKINFSSLEDLRIALARVNEAVEEGRRLTANPLITRESVSNVVKTLIQLDHQKKILQDQYTLALQLSAVTREKLKIENEVLSVQDRITLQQNREGLGIDTTNESLDKQFILRKQLFEVQLKQIHAESVAQAEQIRATEKGVTPEQAENLARKEIEQTRKLREKVLQEDLQIKTKQQKEAQERLGRLSVEDQKQARDIILKLAQDPRLNFVDKQRLENFKKASDEKVKTAKDEAEAITKFFGEESRTDIDREIETARRQLTAAPNIDELKKNFTEAFSPDLEKVAKGTKDAVAAAQKILNENPIKVKVVVDENDIAGAVYLGLNKANVDKANKDALALAQYRIATGVEQGASAS